MRAFLEHWKDIAGYEGIYQVSDFGEVRSLGMWKNGKGNSTYFQEGRVLKPRKNSCGYLYLSLCKNNKKKTHKVHRLVAQAFIPNPDNLSEINHKDENKENNKVENLEWCDHRHNINHGTRNERVADALSEKVIQTTLDYIFVKEFPSVNECGRNGFNISCVSMCCNGKRKTHKGYRWVKAEVYYKEAVA